MKKIFASLSLLIMFAIASVATGTQPASAASPEVGTPCASIGGHPCPIVGERTGCGTTEDIRPCICTSSLIWMCAQP